MSSKSTKSKKRDRNRFRKVYPYLRRKPINEYVLDRPTTIEVGEVIFDNTSGPVSFVFNESYDSIPNITAIAVDTENNGSANVSIFIKEVSTTGVVFEASNAFTGKVHFHIIFTKSLKLRVKKSDWRKWCKNRKNKNGLESNFF